VLDLTVPNTLTIGGSVRVFRCFTKLSSAFLLSICVSQTASYAQLAVGSRVEACPFGNKYYSGTVVGTVQGGFTIRFDQADGMGKDEEYVVPAYKVRGATNTSANSSTSSSAAGGDTSATSSNNTGANQAFAKNAQVDVSPYGTTWGGATVIGTVLGGYTVRMNGSGGFKAGEEYVVPSNRIRSFTNQPVSAAPINSAGSTASTSFLGSTGTPTNDAGTVSRATAGTGNRVHPKNANIKWTTTYTPPGQTGPINSGKGKPPSGTYNCVMWTAGMMINLGKLEINGDSYRGLNAGGGFHSYTIDGSGNMTLSSGLSGMPAGFTLKSVGWVGNDSVGRPLIKITYIGKNNAHDTIDAIKQ
jgi:hypothetical protein